jgi:hypothetical protein
LSPHTLEQCFFRGIWKNEYPEKIGDAVMFLNKNGLVPGYRVIPFYIDGVIMDLDREIVVENGGS